MQVEIGALVALFEFAGQSVQELTPVSRALYLPAGHIEQERAPINENVPAPHGVQDAIDIAPDAAFTFPEGHPTHVEFHG